MKQIAVILFICALQLMTHSCASFSSKLLEPKWIEWKVNELSFETDKSKPKIDCFIDNKQIRNQKNYTSALNARKRKVFMHNYKMVARHNRKRWTGSEHFHLVLNKYADLVRFQCESHFPQFHLFLSTSFRRHSTNSVKSRQKERKQI
jgi:hypothetical protein